MTAKGSQVLETLLDGNLRFRTGNPRVQHYCEERLQEIAVSQSPVATLLTCIDSRVAPEILFDQPQELSISPGRRQPPDSVAVRGVLCTPSRPAAFLDAARGHRLPVPVGPSHTAVPPPTTSSPS